MTLFAEIGTLFIERAITAFYHRAFSDPIIGHFFLGTDQEALIAKQIAFSELLLGSRQSRAKLRSLRQLHHPLKIRSAHFNRRQVLFAEILDELGLAADLRKSWLDKEERLRDQIVVDTTPCV